MDLPSTTSPYTSGQATHGNTEASRDVTQSGVDSSLPFRPILSLNHEGTEPHSPSEEKREEEQESTPLQETPTSKKTKREKQREKRKLKRALKRATTEVDTDQKDHGDNTQDTKKMRHRPSPAQRSARTLVQMDQWSHLFLNRTSSFSSLALDSATAEAMSKAAEKTWGGKNRKRTFRSTQELHQFVSVKDEELQYLKRTLRRASVLQQSRPNSHDSRTCEELISSLEAVFRAWEVDGSTEIEKHEVLEEASRFFAEAIIPCLEAQLAHLRLKLNTARRLKERLDGMELKMTDREELGYRLAGLVEDRTYILPICPAWGKLGEKIAETRGALDESESLSDLREKQKHIMSEYRQSLEWE